MKRGAVLCALSLLAFIVPCVQAHSAETEVKRQTRSQIIGRVLQRLSNGYATMSRQTRELDYDLHRDGFEVHVDVANDTMLDTAFVVGYWIRETLTKNAYTGTATFTIHARLEDGAETELFRKSIPLDKTKVNTFGSWMPVSINLGNYAGQSIDLLFRKEYEAASSNPPRKVLDLTPRDFLIWSEPNLRPQNVPGKPNVILISLDTLSAPHLGFMGYKRDTSPTMDRLAAEGCYFEQCVSQAPWTTPSHMSILTGAYPRVHGANESIVLTDREWNHNVLSLSEVMRGAGYVTGAFTGSGSISAPFGFYRGFDFYQEHEKPNHDEANEIFGEATQWIAKHKNRSYFLFLHTYQIHGPYNHTHFPEVEGLQEVKDDGSESPEVIAYRTALYDSDIRSVDMVLKKFFEDLEAQGLLDNTIVVLTSDHGEDMGGRIPAPAKIRNTHGYDLDDSQLMVPLIFWGKPLAFQKKKIEPQVRSIDIMPTILSMVNVDQPASVQGMSLAPMIEGVDTTARPAFSEATAYGADVISMRYDALKYIRRVGYGTLWNSQSEGLPFPPVDQLYDLKTDGRELQNIADQRAEELRKIQALLDLTLTEIAQSATAAGASGTNAAQGIQTKSDADLKEQLEALGYLE